MNSTNREVFESRCRIGVHPLVEVYRHHGAASDAVVRWCEICGSVTVDEDFDGRTNPGQYRAMTRPLILQRTV